MLSQFDSPGIDKLPQLLLFKKNLEKKICMYP